MAEDDAVSLPPDGHDSDLVNEPVFDVDTGKNGQMAVDGEKDKDTCRICRSEATDEEPLFYPCKCSGSIKYVHQDCLMEWLSHTNKKHCELCKTPFRFTKLYDSQMPDNLPLAIFIRKASMHALHTILVWVRGTVVSAVWLCLLPWCVRWAWRGLFYMMDAGWAREPWIARMEVEALHNTTSGSLNTAPVVDALKAVMSNTNTSAHASPVVGGPIAFQLSRTVWNIVAAPWRSSSVPPDTGTPSTNFTSIRARSTLLSDFEFATSLTLSSSLNDIVLDVVEGQVITILVVVAFILIFLIREWVIQQQPILNAAAHVREAEQQLNRVDRARQRLRGDIEEVERQLRMMNGETSDSDDTEETQQAGGNINISTDDISANASNAQIGNPISTIDWASFERRIRAASSVPPLRVEDGDQAAHGDIRRLTDELLSIVRQAQDQGRSDEQTLSHLTEWIRTIPHDVDTRWLSQLRAAFSRLKIAQTDRRDPDNIHTGTEDPDRTVRPIEVNHALRSLEAEIEDEDSTHATGSGSAGGSPPGSPAREHNSSDSGTEGSWTRVNESSTSLVENSAEHEVPIDDPLHVSMMEVNNTSSPSASSHASSTNETSTEAQRTRSPDAVGSEPRSQASTEPEDPEQTPHGGIDHVQDGSVQEGPPAHRRRPRNALQRLADWFWADIVLTAPEPATAVVAVDDDQQIVHDIADEAPFVPAHDTDSDITTEPGDEQDVDPEVAAAAAEAGLDAEAVEEAEDLEGIMELIGMQGPIIGLVQTAMFCGVLVTVTLWGAIGAPYLFGKLALLFIGDPILFFVILPLQLVANLGDFLLDTGTLMAGGFVYTLVNTLATVFAPLRGKYTHAVMEFTQSACKYATERLSGMFMSEDAFDTLDSGFLLVSIQAHKSLLDLKSELAQVFVFIARTGLTSYQYLRGTPPLKCLDDLRTGLPQLIDKTTRISIWLRGSTRFFISSENWAMTLRRQAPLQVQPSHAFWTGGDRALTVLLGYSFLAMIGAAFLLRKKPLFTSPTLHKMEKNLADMLKQAGGVLKVILIISIEMLMFPLYCGMLLDCALLPLFQGATVSSRLDFASRSPSMFMFLHWFLGTAYMFNFALFVSMCRRILRSGVLYFIRDPDDPTFHPVRDVLERNVGNQLRKIGFSALVYGLLVILCLGGVIWGIEKSFVNVFPIRWSTPEPILEFPIDFLFYNFLSPFLIKFMKPSSDLEALYEWWLRKCAHQLRLSHFLFGERKEDEEDRVVDQSSSTQQDSEKRRDSPSQESISVSRSGRYVRVPASDQVRIPRGETVFVPVSEKDVTKGEADQECTLHGKADQKFRNIYIPPWFRMRIGLFLVCLWTLSAAIGGSFTLLPLLIGRQICWMVLPMNVQVNDIWAFASGLHTQLMVAFIGMKIYRAVDRTKDKISGMDFGPLIESIKHYTTCAAKALYVYGFAAVIIPAVLALSLQLYIILPLRTYLDGAAASVGATLITESVEPSNLTTILSDATMTESAPSPNSESWLALHNIYLLQDWTLGFLWGRVILRIASMSQTSLPAAIFRQVTRNGYFNPDARLATRAFVLPVLLFSIIIVLGPLLLASVINNVLLRPVLVAGLAEISKVKLYRYSYPVCASQALLVWAAYGFGKLTAKWRSRIKDEVYLIGERLHNFGERKPPPGSRSVPRKDRA